LRVGSSSIKDVIQDGLDWLEISKVVRQSDLLSVLIPDQSMSDVYDTSISRYLKPGKVLLFSHGYNITYKQIVPPHFIDVVMVAPSGPGYAVREEYKKGKGVPTLVAINQDVTGKAKDIVLAYSKAIGGTRSCCFVSNFKEETETDLFGEQIVLTGIIPMIINESFKVLLEAGYSPVVSWFVSFYEVKQITDLLSTMSIDEFYKAIRTAKPTILSRITYSLIEFINAHGAQ
jgi:ketol-acid reductoisomerase